jgi:hypothetical protein
MPTRIKARRGTAAQWTTANPTLADGEFGFERDTNKLKIGNGTSAWAALPYVTGGDGSVPSDVLRTTTPGVVLYQTNNAIVGGDFVAEGFYRRTVSGWDYPPVLQELTVERFSITAFPYTPTLADARNELIFLSPTAAATVILPPSLIGNIAPANRRLWLDVAFVIDPSVAITFTPGSGVTLFVAAQPGAQASYVVNGPKKVVVFQTRGTTWRQLG